MSNFLSYLRTKAQLPVNRKPTNTQSDDEDEDAADPEFINKMKRRRDASQELHRKGVSAEVYGKYNKRTDFKPVVIKKDAEQKKRIMDRINVNVFLKGLGDEDKEIIVNAMKEVKFKKGEKVIQQGDTGDDFYVIDSGEVDCLRSNKPGESARYLKTYVAGEGFGELALLYNAPRAATLVCKTPCTLFALDRQTFNHVVRESTIKKRQRYEEIINHIELLNGMENYEKYHNLTKADLDRFSARGALSQGYRDHPGGRDRQQILLHREGRSKGYQDY